MAVGSPTLPARYRDARPVGRGGMADIYRATDADLGRSVAVKVLAEHCAEDDDIRQRFLREALAAARLSGDPHTVTIYDVGESDGRPYLVMEYLPGGSLVARLAAGPVDRAQAMEWLEQAARALDAAHARGVVHRVVKPGNLLLDKDGNVCVADFGIARAAGVDSNTQTGVILGTVGYLAPEQAAGGRPGTRSRTVSPGPSSGTATTARGGSRSSPASTASTTSSSTPTGSASPFSPFPASRACRGPCRASRERLSRRPAAPVWRRARRTSWAWKPSPSGRRSVAPWRSSRRRTRR